MSTSAQKDISKLRQEDKLALLKQHSPELQGLVEELKERIEELQQRVTPLQEYVRKLRTEQVTGLTDELVEYLEVKQQLLLSYVTNVTFYLYMKSLGKSLKSHPVMAQLLRLRYALEKLQGIDQKVKYQIDRLVKLADANASAQEVQKSLLRPNVAAMMDEDDSDDDDEDDRVGGKKVQLKSRAILSTINPSQQKKSSKKAQDSDDDDEEDDEDDDAMDEDAEEIYKASKRMSTPYLHDNDNTKESRKRDKLLAKQRDKLRHSELVDALREEFGQGPEQAGSGGLDRDAGDAQRLVAEQQERTNFEEDRFVRMQLTRKEKQSIKRREKSASRLDNFDDIGDFADLEALSKLASSAAVNVAAANSNNKAGSSLKAASSASGALTRAFQTLQGGASSSSMRDGDDDSDDYDHDDGDYEAMERESSGRKRRRAPEMDAGDSDDDHEAGAVFDDFLQKKDKYQQQKKAHYTAAPRYGGFEETVEEGGKRAASYEIMKNKGLTPHRKKENRNPRVKKREKYASAVVRRKGAVRDVIAGVGAGYAGESTGIKATVSRSRKMK